MTATVTSRSRPAPAVDGLAWSVWLPPTLLDEESRRLWIEEMGFDPRPVFARVRVPTMLFYGEADTWVPVEPSVQAWRAATRSRSSSSTRPSTT